MRGAPKSANNVTITLFNTVHLLPKDLRFEHEGAKLASCPGRHLPRYGPDCVAFSSHAGKLNCTVQRYFVVVVRLVVFCRMFTWCRNAFLSSHDRWATSPPPLAASGGQRPAPEAVTWPALAPRAASCPSLRNSPSWCPVAEPWPTLGSFRRPSPDSSSGTRLWPTTSHPGRTRPRPACLGRAGAPIVPCTVCSPRISSAVRICDALGRLYRTSRQALDGAFARSSSLCPPATVACFHCLFRRARATPLAHLCWHSDRRCLCVFMFLVCVSFSIAAVTRDLRVFQDTFTASQATPRATLPLQKQSFPPARPPCFWLAFWILSSVAWSLSPAQPQFALTGMTTNFLPEHVVFLARFCSFFHGTFCPQCICHLST